MEKVIRDELLSEEQNLILTLWIEGATLGAIAKKTGLPVATISRKLKQLQKKMVEDLFDGIDETVERMQHGREETDKLKEETRSNISDLQRMIAA